MIVERFLQWVRTAPVSRRAEAAHALARSYLYSPLAQEERDGVEAAMTVLLDDPAAHVRYALADALGASDKAPHHIILTLAADQAHPRDEGPTARPGRPGRALYGASWPSRSRKVMNPWVGSYGERPTWTRSPGITRMRKRRMRPESWAVTVWPESSSIW